MAQSISDPKPIGGSLGRNCNRSRLLEDFSPTPSPATARARAKESKKRNKLRREKLLDADDEDAASFSSGSTYYVLPGPGQKIKVMPPTTMNGLYAEPASKSKSKSTPALQSHHSQNGPYLPPPPLPPAPQPSQLPKRPLFQRIFHPQVMLGSSTGASSSRRTSRR